MDRACVLDFDANVVGMRIVQFITFLDPFRAQSPPSFSQRAMAFPVSLVSPRMVFELRLRLFDDFIEILLEGLYGKP